MLPEQGIVGVIYQSSMVLALGVSEVNDDFVIIALNTEDNVTYTVFTTTGPNLPHVSKWELVRQFRTYSEALAVFSHLITN